MTKAYKPFIDSLRKNPKGRIIYTYRGNIELGRGGTYKWFRGYSATLEDGGILYPWMSFTQCRENAKRFGLKAVFEKSSVKFAC